MKIRNHFFMFCIMMLGLGTGMVWSAENSPKQGFEPSLNLIIRPSSLYRPAFAVKGSVAIPAEVEKVNFVRIPWQKFVYSVNGAEQKLGEDGLLVRPASLSASESWQVDFIGVSQLRPPKSMATGDEVYCLNNFPPNPELVTDMPSRYKVKFDLPQGYSAISFDEHIASSMGLQFQIARFQKPLIRKTANFTFEYVFPEGFSAEPTYLEFLENTMEKWFALFGDPGFDLVRIGVIRRGEAKGEINGSPCGNLILLSRSALGGNVNLKGLAPLGIKDGDEDQFRKLVIAHELSHFWFGVKFAGKDGWMTEGIPQYLGLYAVHNEDPEKAGPLLAFTRYLDRMIPQDAIPNNPFSENQVLYIKAYYQGSLALFTIGESIGHENLCHLLTSVFNGNRNPEFKDFDREFLKLYSDKHEEWLKAWRM